MIEKLVHILELTQDIVIELDRDGTYVNIWTKDESLLARPKAELIGRKLTEVLTQEEAGYYLSLARTVIESEKTEEIFYKMTTLKGETHFRGTIVPLKIDVSVTAAFIVKDITEKVRMQGEYDRQKDMLNDIVENSPGVVFQCLINKKGEVSFPYLAKNIYDVYGYTREEIHADNSLMHKVKHPDEKKSFYEKLDKVVADKTKLDWVGKIISKEGKQKWIHVQGFPRSTEEGKTLVTGLFIDITNQKMKEQELSLKQAKLNHQLKLASLGELAAGVGHEINNPLNIVINTLTVLKSKNESKKLSFEELDKLLNVTLIASNRISTIVKGLKSLSRKDADDQFRKFDYREVLDTTFLLVKELCQKDQVEFKLTLKSDKELVVEGVKGEIEQVLMNLLSNAIDAVSGRMGAKIEMSVDVDDEGKKIITKVSDNGAGIPSEILSRILDPFFTTKEVGKGTGLGLSIVNNIVTKHNGKLNFESSEESTSVYLSLPLKGS